MKKMKKQKQRQTLIQRAKGEWLVEGRSGWSCGNLPHLRCKFLAELKEPEKQVSEGSVLRRGAGVRPLNDNTGRIEIPSLCGNSCLPVSVQETEKKGFCWGFLF